MVGGIVALLVTIALATHHSGPHPRHVTEPSPATRNGSAPSRSSVTETSVPIRRPVGRIRGRYYPALDHNDTTTLVLPSGRTIILTGDLRDLIGGLGAIFTGAVTKTTPTCCSLNNPINFLIFRAAPNDLFNIRNTGAVPSPLAIAPSQVRNGVDGLRGSEYRFVILSTGGWTLVAGVLGGQTIADPNALHGWHLRATSFGAVLIVPADSHLSYETVLLGRTPDLTDRELMLSTDLCSAGFTKSGSLTETSTDASWCDESLQVNLDGPPSFVNHAVSGLIAIFGPRT